MPLPSSFGSRPDKTNHKYFFNLCLDFKKTIAKTPNIEELDFGMQKILDASKEMNWKEPTHHAYKKNEGEKLLNKLFSEFSRYEGSVREGKLPSTQDLLTALEGVIAFFQEKRVE